MLEIVEFSICAMISTKTSQEFVLPKTSKNFELSEEDQFSILRCAKEGQIFSHLDPTKKCHSPLTRGPCDTDEVVVIDQQTLLGKKNEFSSPVCHYSMFSLLAKLLTHVK